MTLVTTLRQFLAFVLAGALAVPAWSGSSSVVGVALDTEGTQVRGQALTVGATLFSGDGISVDAKGDAKISLSGGGQVEVLADSAAVLTRGPSAVQMVVERGSASFRSEPGTAVEALMADATIRAVPGSSAIAVITLESPDSAVVVADKNALEIATAHDSRTLLVPEGSAARITLVSQQDSGQAPSRTAAQIPVPAGQGGLGFSLSSKEKFAIVALIFSAALLTAGLIVAHHEHKVVNVVNEVSPFQLK
jgi:hypothetical protein